MSASGAGRANADHPAPGATRNLPRCVGVDPDTFAARHWGIAPLLSRGAELSSSFEDLFDLDAADELLSRRGLRTPFLRMARDGEVVGSGQFTGSGGAGAEIADQVRDDRVAELFAAGSTVVLQGLHRCWPPLIDFARGLATELGHPVQVNAYLTPPSKRGFAAHYDVHDVFVLQLAGSKKWTVHAPVHPDPLRDQPSNARADEVARAAAETEPLLEPVLEPGDALYLPRGYLHAAQSLGATSAHLTVGVHTVTRFALVEALCALVADRAELRGALPMGIDVGDPAALAPHLRAVVEQLTTALPEVPAADVADRVRDRVWAGARAEPLGPIAQAGFAADAGPGSAVRLRGGLRCRLRDDEARTVLDLPGRAVTLPAAARPALERLLDGSEVRVGELPGLDGEDRLDVVRRLLREGVVVPARVT